MPHRNIGDSRHRNSRKIGKQRIQERKERRLRLHEEVDEYNRIMQLLLTDHPELEAIRGTQEGNQKISALYQERKLLLSLEKLLNQYDSCYLECDGLTRVLATVLTWEYIPHTVYFGAIVYKPTGKGFYPHMWIMVGPFTVDYRARMWLGESPDIPHGIFKSENFPVRYEGEPIISDPLPIPFFTMLTAKTIEDLRFDNLNRE